MTITKMNIKQQIQDAAVDMMKQVRRADDEKGHHYERVSDGKWMAGVTEVCGLLPKDWMPAWGAKEAVKAFGYFDKCEGEESLEELDKAAKIKTDISKMTLDEYLIFLHEAKGAFRRKSDKAKQKGTDGHAWLEIYCKALIRSQQPPEVPDSWLKQPLQSFIDWHKENIKEFYLAEALVSDTENEFAGTLDALAETKNGKLAIVDFKFADNESDSWRLQTSAYAKPFWKYGLLVTERLVVRFPKSEWLLRWDKNKRNHVKKPNKFEIISYGTGSMGFDFQTFLHLRHASRWINKSKKENN